MQNDINNETPITTLPSSPVIYMSIMRTLKGKPISMPIWSSFENRTKEKSLENESVSSTFLSLAKKMSEMAEDIDSDGKIVRLELDRRIFNIYVPHPDAEFQISFVIVFEERDNVVIEKKYRTELVHEIYNELSEIDELHKFLDNGVDEQIKKGSKLHTSILEKVEKRIKEWDKKRVKYLKTKREEEKRKKEELQRMKQKEKEKEELEAESDQSEDEKI